jgi:hypothetical protein
MPCEPGGKRATRCLRMAPQRTALLPRCSSNPCPPPHDSSARRRRPTGKPRFSASVMAAAAAVEPPRAPTVSDSPDLLRDGPPGLATFYCCQCRGLARAPPQPHRPDPVRRQQLRSGAGAPACGRACHPGVLLEDSGCSNERTRRASPAGKGAHEARLTAVIRSTAPAPPRPGRANSPQRPKGRAANGCVCPSKRVPAVRLLFHRPCQVAPPVLNAGSQ